MAETMDESRFHEMLSLARSGDHAGADCLFVICYPRLYQAVIKNLDSVLRKARLEPEDIIQEVYAAAWPRLAEGEFANFSAFFGWLKTIARNKIIDLRRALLADKHDVRRQRSEAGQQATTYIALVDRLAAVGTTPSSAAARQEAVALLVGQMWRLPEDYRRIVQWRFIQGLSTAEVAQRLGRSEPAVHMLTHRALIKLRQLMGSPSKYLSRA